MCVQLCSRALTSGAGNPACWAFQVKRQQPKPLPSPRYIAGGISQAGNPPDEENSPQTHLSTFAVILGVQNYYEN